MFLEFVTFDFWFIKQVKNDFDNVSNELRQTKQELEKIKDEMNQLKIIQQQTKSELKREEIKHNQTKSELKREEIKHNQTKSELESEKIKHNQTKSELKREEIKHNQTKSELENEKIKHNQIKIELDSEKIKHNQTKSELENEKIKHNQTKSELDKCEKVIKQTKDEFVRDKIDKNQHPQAVFACGLDDCNQLVEKPNKKNHYGSIISPPMKLSIDLSSLLSYSIYCLHSVIVTSDGSLKGIGDNRDGRISATLQKKKIDNFTEFSIKDKNGRQLSAVSAVCCYNGTLYMFSKISCNERQLVLCDRSINGGTPVFLDIGNHQPVSLFGGHDHSAAIGSEGEVIFINRNSVINSPDSPIAAVSLPDGEKASSVACCNDSVVVLSSNGRVFTSPIKSNQVLNFSVVSELSSQDIVCVSGTYSHFFAVSKEGHVFGCGSNKHGELAMKNETKSVSTFTKISSLSGYEIRAAYTGLWHSIFETREGKILSCGEDDYGELLLSSDICQCVYSPTETTITGGASFCIAGEFNSVVFIGGSPLPNSPNIRVKQYQ